MHFVCRTAFWVHACWEIRWTGVHVWRLQWLVMYYSLLFISLPSTDWYYFVIWLLCISYLLYFVFYWISIYFISIWNIELYDTDPCLTTCLTGSSAYSMFCDMFCDCWACFASCGALNVSIAWTVVAHSKLLSVSVAILLENSEPVYLTCSCTN